MRRRMIVLRRRVRVDQQIERLPWRAVDVAAAAAHLPDTLDSRFRGNVRTYRTARRIAK
jgi:hypothetical protein